MFQELNGFVLWFYEYLQLSCYVYYVLFGSLDQIIEPSKFECVWRMKMGEFSCSVCWFLHSIARRAKLKTENISFLPNITQATIVSIRKAKSKTKNISFMQISSMRPEVSLRKIVRIFFKLTCLYGLYY